MTLKKDQIIKRLLNLRDDDSTSPEDFYKYSIQQIHYWIEIEEEKKRVAAEAAEAATPAAEAPAKKEEEEFKPLIQKAFEYIFS
jgi:hypothetical protein